MIFLYILLFIFSCSVLFFSGSLLIKSLTKLARILGWREFVVAFFVMAFATSLPNLFVGINSALHKIPELSLGDTIGGNVVDLTLVVALAVLAAGRAITVESRMVQSSAVFTAVIAILPLLLVWDGNLSRGDGWVLILAFFFYVAWLFARQERFKKAYQGDKQKALPISCAQRIKQFLKNLSIIVGCLILLALSSEAMVRSAVFFAQKLRTPLSLIGILIVGLGNALPEAYFAVIAARKSEFYLILGDLLGSVIVPATLVLGIVALICPIELINPESLFVARIFLLLASLLFLAAIRTGKRITKKEALVLLFLYLCFVAVEILIK